MLIGCDVDQVVANLNEEWLRRYNIEYDDTLCVAELVSWDISKFVKPECGKNIDKYLHQRGLYDCIKEIPNALWGVCRLRRQGHRVVFITSDPSGGKSGKIDWLYNHYFAEDQNDWIVAHDKSLIRMDIMIDDSPRNIASSTATFNLLFNQPWNQDAEGAYVRVNDWHDTVEWVERVASLVKGYEQGKTLAEMTG